MTARPCLCLLALSFTTGIYADRPEWDDVPIFRVHVERRMLP